MHYLDYNEQIQHKTGDFPMAYYYVDQQHPRYHMPMHWHRETEIIHICSGSLHLYIDNMEVSAQEGDLMMIGEGVIHGGDPADCIYECLVFDPNPILTYIEACKRSLKPLIRHNIFLKQGAILSEPACADAVGRLFRYASYGIAGNELNIMGALYEFYGIMLERRFDAQMDTVSSRSGQRAEQLKPALEYIEAHYAQSISLESLARLTGLSTKYFCRYFKAIVHRSPIDYVNYYRVECASYFLSTSDMTIAEIAQHCGYNDSSFFIKQFRKYKGITPKQYRAK